MTFIMPTRAIEYSRKCTCGKLYDCDTGDEADDAGVCWDCIEEEKERKKREEIEFEITDEPTQQ